jgi:acyl transferase domain-containing protein
MNQKTDQEDLSSIAVIGMSGRFPGAKNIEQFWHNLANGVETISRFGVDELEFSVATPEALAQGQTFIRARAILEDVDKFDAAFFNIYPREAESMDPQHRLFLECAWEALENGGYDPDRYQGMIGVYAGVSMNTYLLYNLCAQKGFAAHFAGNYQTDLYQVMFGNDKDFMPTRVSYKLNLRGPSMSIQSACSTSLVAICQACTSLLNYQCDMALAGGASISFPQKRDYLYQDQAMLSADGTCRAFDATSNGTVFGHGVGVVLLKRLADALEEGDNILAVIKGTALNNDGSNKIGYAAPSVNAQAEVVALAQAAAGVEPETISFIEAHGTGTPLGDPIEVAALTKAFREAGAKRKGYCAIGTAKSYIGHLDVAAGVSGLIKVILQLQHELIPPLYNFTSPNPKIDFVNSPFFPVTKKIDWKRGECPRRAGVSALGVGGTNAHVVVEEAPLIEACSASRPLQLLVLSAKTPSALKTMAANLAEHLEGHPDLSLADVGYTLQIGRKLFAHRWAIVASDMTNTIEQLKTMAIGSMIANPVIDQNPSIIFLFPGQGAQYLNMGRELYEQEVVFQDEVDRCAEILQHNLGVDIRKVLYADNEDAELAGNQINQTWLAQPALFVIEYALARLWMSWGIKPSVLIGHSIGEYVAAVLAEVFMLEDALTLLSARARLMQVLPAGSMLAVRLGEDELERPLPEEIAIAAVNSPKLCVVSGPTEIIQRFMQDLELKNIATRVLHTSHAFHSAMMDPMLPEFGIIAQQIQGGIPKIPWISTCTGEWMSSHEPVAGDYWVQQIRRPVQFSAALGKVIEDPRNILLEVGPGQTLSQLVRQQPQKQAGLKVVATMAPFAESGQELKSLLGALGRLWVAGAGVDWKYFYTREKRRRVPLPTYPFERKSYWIEPTMETTEPMEVSTQPKSVEHLETMQEKEDDMIISQTDNTIANSSRKERLINELKNLFKSYSGTDHGQTEKPLSLTLDWTPCSSLKSRKAFKSVLV